MSKNFLRAIALLLIPCLVGNPLIASVFSAERSTQNPSMIDASASRLDLYNQEALIRSLVMAPRNIQEKWLLSLRHSLTHEVLVTENAIPNAGTPKSQAWSWGIASLWWGTTIATVMTLHVWAIIPLVFAVLSTVNVYYLQKKFHEGQYLLYRDGEEGETLIDSAWEYGDGNWAINTAGQEVKVHPALKRAFINDPFLLNRLLEIRESHPLQRWTRYRIFGITVGDLFVHLFLDPFLRLWALLSPFAHFVELTAMTYFRQSFSGVRAIMSPSNYETSTFHRIYLIAFAFWGFFYALNRFNKFPDDNHLPDPKNKIVRLVLGQDTRRSRIAVRDAMARGFNAAARLAHRHIEIYDVGIVTTPMAEHAVRMLEAHGGVIITASHNPFRENGIKFMTNWNDEPGESSGRGALLHPEDVQALKNSFARVRSSRREYFQLALRLRTTPQPVLHRVNVRELRQSYLDFLKESLDLDETMVELLHGFHIIIDPNGGAAVGHAKWILEQLGFVVKEINNTPGVPRHSLEPKEGSDGLIEMNRLLGLHENILYQLGLVFDNDADRGTLAPQMEPQEVSALVVAMQLARTKAYGLNDEKEVVAVVHDATSLRVNDILDIYKHSWRRILDPLRVETGEINVVTAMQNERKIGRYVPIGVEGANGGSVIATTTCRDGLAMLITIAASLRDPKTLLAWFDSLKEAGYTVQEPLRHKAENQTLTLKELVSTLPTRYSVLKNKENIHVDVPQLKREMQKAFDAQWAADGSLQRDYPSYKFLHYEGTESREGDPFGEGMGGWRLVLTRHDGKKEFLWLRPSRTGPEMRYLIDAVNEESGVYLESLFDSILDVALQTVEHSTSSTPTPLPSPDRPWWRFFFFWESTLFIKAPHPDHGLDSNA